MDIVLLFLFTAFAFCIIYWMIRERQNVKTAYYGTTTCSVSSFTGNPVLDRWTQTKETLSEQESKAHEILSKVSANTLWGEAIRITLLRRDNNAFRELVSQLYTEGIAAPSTMINIIGADGWLAVCRCKECSYYN
jgi:hypothetical protein